MSLYSELEKRAVPALRSREEMKEIMQREVYGYLPEVEYKMTVGASNSPTIDEIRFACGNVHLSHVTMTIEANNRSHSFRVDRLLHQDGKKRPLIVHINFHPMGASIYFPIEEMSEYDADFLLVRHSEISSDDYDFSHGLAPVLLPDGQVKDTDCGKIGIWAWAAMRVIDYGLTLPGTDPDNIGVAGHSRLGKTAAYVAMMDERVRFTLTNAAGCAGDTLAHGGSGLNRPYFNQELGELIEDMVRVFPFWFCKNYRKYAAKNMSDEFDQHFLIASIAPRYVMIGSCDLDGWADPKSQQLCALAASGAWEDQGLDGLVGGSDHYLEPGEALIDGHVGYFMIHSKHFLSRHCWRNFMAFVEKHKGEK